MIAQQFYYLSALIIAFKSILLIKNCNCMHIIGDYNTDEFFKFLVKFGFQKNERHSQKDSYGYIYGNITSNNSFYEIPITLAVLDKYSFLEFYGNRSNYDRDIACQKMFSRLQNFAYDQDCNKHAKTDYLRRIPCNKNELCIDEDTPSNVIKNNQFTFVLNNLMQPRFWYISIVSCYRNRTTCEWHYYDYKSIAKQYYQKHKNSTIIINNLTPPILHYDFYLVNGNPNLSTAHPLTFQFSFDQQNLLEMYLVFLLVYLILVPMQIYAVRIQKHPVTKLFTLSLIIEFISLSFITTHFINFAFNGIGHPDFQTVGDILDIFSRTSFMLILLLLAKGWAVTRQQISKTGWIILMSIWIPYCAFHVFLYIWNKTEVDIISDIDEYQTWPGWIVLVCRTLFMLWFLWELRNTMKYEHSVKKLDFLLHFGASSLVWFIYLPIVAIVALQVDPMWRYKLLLGITNSADCIAYCVMTGLLWPNRVGQYLLLAGINYTGMDELDEFNEAPHIVRERELERDDFTRSNSINHLNDRTTITINGMTSDGSDNINNRINNNSRNSNINGDGDNIGGISDTNHLLNGDISTDLLGEDDFDTELLANLNKHSHVIA